MTQSGSKMPLYRHVFGPSLNALPTNSQIRLVAKDRLVTLW